MNFTTETKMNTPQLENIKVALLIRIKFLTNKTSRPQLVYRNYLFPATKQVSRVA